MYDMAIGPGTKFPAVHSQLPVLDLIIWSVEVLEGQRKGPLPRVFADKGNWFAMVAIFSLLHGWGRRISAGSHPQRGAEGTSLLSLFDLPFSESSQESIDVCFY